MSAGLSPPDVAGGPGPMSARGGVEALPMTGTTGSPHSLKSTAGQCCPAGHPGAFHSTGDQRNKSRVCRR